MSSNRSNIISVSRRTDIPAFHGDWFNKCIEQGKVTVPNVKAPGSRTVSLKKDDVTCFVFWSKNFTPFLSTLHALRDEGFRSYFNYTVNRFPSEFEPEVNSSQAIGSLRAISRMYSPAHINWRYDPIVISGVTSPDWHRANFRQLCGSMQGYVERCYIAFPVLYGKVVKNITAFRARTGISIQDPDIKVKQELANDLSDIATDFGIRMLSCSNDLLINDKIGKAHCIDGAIISSLYGKEAPGYRPSRNQCGCTASVDIGNYDTCKHGCVYCYANTSRTTINNMKAQEESSPSSPAVGVKSATGISVEF